MRVNNETKKVIRIAADILSRSITDFVIYAAYEEAKRVISEHDDLNNIIKCKKTEMLYNI